MLIILLSKKINKGYFLSSSSLLSSSTAKGDAAPEGLFVVAIIEPFGNILDHIAFACL